jgi:hypothetical protein
LMATIALQRFHGPAFSLVMPIPMFMRIQEYLSTSIQVHTSLDCGETRAISRRPHS